ncbi:Nucleotide-binding universal stress protein, UspA family [Pustulibacterium marinum]|uniref:Nucleotide-binding universal stress protein, UspA family n=1 Tax=Pustulibacterium marinum TaxID=1224947 RepID=A0A1I7HAN8_9FLAO|nr:universal stress protein [Pustulibacterium marinum]SFU57774.1 Nucleotide-binding universal stress protein, UspA family [Pustulibacterium marinum]
MKRILVPTDFSEQAEYALQTAALIAKKHDAELFLLHMLNLPVHLLTNDKSELPEAIYFMKLAHKQFEDFMDKPYLEDINTHEIVEANETALGIKEATEKHNIDLIVMGSSGASGISEIFVGSNTEKVVRYSEKPVLVVKNPMTDVSNIDDMVYACSFAEELKESFKKAVTFAEDFNKTLHILYVNTPNNFKTTHEIERRIKTFLKDTAPSKYTINIYNDETVEEGILNFANSIKADMLSISTHGRKGIAQFFNGSISEDLVNHAIRPVITFKV